MTRVRIAALLGTGLLLVGVAGAADDAPSPYAGEEVCRACHEEVADAYAKTPHAAPLADATRPQAMRACEACHGPGQAHADAGGSGGGLETFARTRPATARSTVCLKCHAGGLHDFRRGEHAMAAVACNDCHRVHTGKSAARLLAKPLPGLCYDCHLEIRAKFALPEHHKVPEGAVSCLDCHTPHGNRRFALMRGSESRERCERCHADLQGPYVYEHAGAFVEGCERCHDPHGSVNRHLLIRQQVAQLCYECHTVTPSSHVQPNYRDCTRCHVSIHGSNTDPRFLEQ